MENNIQTAEELARNEYDDNRPDNIFMERQVDMKWAIFMMQRFAKLHVQAQQEAILENAKVKITARNASYINKDSIINAYPLNLIK